MTYTADLKAKSLSEHAAKIKKLILLAEYHLRADLCHHIAAGCRLIELERRIGHKGLQDWLKEISCDQDKATYVMKLAERFNDATLEEIDALEYDTLIELLEPLAPDQITAELFKIFLEDGK